jgi:hypothetical protein
MKRFLPVTLFTLGLFGIAAFDILDNTGKAGYCGSPSESYCTSCHSGSALNSGGGSVTISGAPSVYTLGQTYNISVTVTQTGRSLFGFAMEALTTPGNANAGTLTVTNSETHVLTASNGRKSMTHTLNGGATADSHTFTFDWKAPTTNVGTVKFWAVGNAANGNNASSGDLIYSTNLVISAPVGIAETEDVLSLQMYPNPVRDQLYLAYDLDVNTAVNATLFSLDGRSCGELLSSEQDKGRHQVALQLPGSLAPGIYFLRLSAGERVTVKKIVVE